MAGSLVKSIPFLPRSCRSLLVEGSLTYDGIIEGLGRGKAPEGFVKTTHGLVSFFPIMTGLMALPIYAPVIAIMRLLASPSPQDWVKLAWRFQKLPAAVFATLAVLAFWRLCEAIEFPSSLSICLTLWLAFGSELFSVGAQSLWQHGPGMLAVIATVDAQVRLRNHPTTRQALVLSTFCGLAIAIRPTNVLIVGPFGLLGLVQQPRLWLPLFAPVAAALALLIAYNLHFFGVELGGYAWVPRTVAIGNLGQGLPGLLFSPGRGLLIYFVVTAVAAAALALRPRTLTDPTAAAAVFGAVATFLLFSCFPWWWGGLVLRPAISLGDRATHPAVAWSRLARNGSAAATGLARCRFRSATLWNSCAGGRSLFRRGGQLERQAGQCRSGCFAAMGRGRQSNF